MIQNGEEANRISLEEEEQKRESVNKDLVEEFYKYFFLLDKVTENRGIQRQLIKEFDKVKKLKLLYSKNGIVSR